jgi:peroxiredoxin Q/BCP
MPSLKIGDLAPPIVGTTHDGKPFRLEALRGQNVVIYFYPAAFTPLCTIETRKFRDRQEEIAKLGGTIVGVSGDSQDTQCEFAQKEGVQFPMVADPKRALASAYDIKWPLLPRAQRVTFVIDKAGRVAGRIHHELSADRHVAGAIEVLQKLQKLPGS